MRKFILNRLRKFTSYRKELLLAVLTGFVFTSASSQQVIGSFPNQDGGFEGQTAGALGTTSSTTTWWLSASITGSIQATGGRSGPKYSNINMTGSTHRTLRGPAIETFAAATSYIIQFYYRGDKNADGTADYGNIRGGINGSTFAYGSYVTDANTGSNWTKYTAAVTPGASTATGHAVVSIIEVAAKVADFDIDDVVIYAGAAADVTAPGAPTAPGTSSPTTSALTVGWTPPGGGVDGGGYVVVRYTVNPDATDLPNANGIYAIGNTMTVVNTGTVRYIGTGSSFTDNVGLSAGTTYYYKIYTVDKAFNYSTAATCNGTTTSSGTTTISAGAGTEPATISSLVTTSGTASLNFDFTITDDGSTPGTDAIATRISQLVIGQGSGNDIADWTQAIAGAELSDGTTTVSATSITATGITFGSLSNSVAGDFGYIADDGNKTYTLKIWLKTSLGGTLPADIDGKNFVFNIQNSGVTLVAGGLASSQSVSSVSTENEVTVVATTLVFTTQPAPTTINANTNFSTAAIVKARDANGNLDLNYNAAITSVTNSQGFTMTNAPSGSFSSGSFTFPTNFQFSTGGGTATTITLNTATLNGTSTAITVNPPTAAITVTSYAHNSTFGYGSKTWGSNTDQTFTIVNNGSAVLNISSIVVSGTGFSLFSGGAGSVALGGGTATFTVRFTPNNVGPFTGTVVINSDATPAAYTINLTGAGTPSASSDMIANALYSYNSNINYAGYQSIAPTLLTNTAQCIDLFKFDIRDGGGAADADNLPTILTGITFNVTNLSMISQAALFDGNTMISNTPTINSGAGTIAFSGMSYSTADGGTQSLTLRVTFASTVTDNTQFQVTINNANVTAAGSNTSSLFTSFTAVASSTTGDRNRLEVTASKLVFGQQPSNTTTNTTMTPAPTVRALDALNNLDLDYTGTIYVSSTGTMTGSPISQAATAGVATFSSIVHTVAGTGYTLSAYVSPATLTGATSNTFDIILFAYQTGDFKPKYPTDLSFNGDWEYYNGTNWVAVPDAKAPQNTTTTIGRVLITTAVTGGGNATKAYNCDFIILSGGELTLYENLATPTAEMIATGKKMEVLNGGVLNIQGDIDLNSNGNLIVRSGGVMILDQNSINAVHPMWEGIELFEGGSEVWVLDWSFTTSSGANRTLVNSGVSSISNNANGYKFGNLIIDITNSSINDWTLTGGPYYYNLCENDLTITYNSSNTLYGASNANSGVGFYVKGNMTVNGTGPFSFGGSFATGVFNQKFDIDGNFSYTGSSTLKTHTNAGGTLNGLSSNINVKGNFTVGSTCTGFSGDKSTGTTPNQVSKVNLNGSGTVQSLSVYPTAVAVPITIKAGASAKLSDYNLTLNSLSSVTADFTVEGTATFDFNWNSSNTPLIITQVASPAGTSRFVSAQGSILKITSPGGLIADPTTYGSNVGNVQNLATSNRQINNLATFWYTGKTNQTTGDGFGAGISNGRQVIVDLANNSITLTPTVTFGLTNNTTISATGGKLDIRKGQFIETETAYVTGTSGTLYMSGGTLYKIMKGSSTAGAAYADLIPRMTGGTFTYNLTGGTIELGANTAGNYFQVFRNNPVGLTAYKYVKYSGTNTYLTDYKALSSAVTIDSALIITGDVVVDCIEASGQARSFDGNGGLIMDGGRLRIKNVSTTNPELAATNAGTSYNITGGTIEFYGSTSTQQHNIRARYGSPTVQIQYNNIEINATAGNYSTPAGAGNADPVASLYIKGALTVFSPAVFRLDATDFIEGPGNFILSSGSGLMYANTNGITSGNTISGNIQNIAPGTRSFSAGANYGFIGSGNMVSGNGLPATVNGMYLYKTTAANQVTLTNAVGIDSIFNLTSGVLMTGTSNMLTVLSTYLANAASGTPGLNSYVNGPMKKAGATDFTFPVGKLPVTNTSTGKINGGYRPIGISSLTGSETFQAEFILADPYLQGPISAAALGAGLQRISRCEYWNLTRAGAERATVTLSWSSNPGGHSQCNYGQYVNDLVSLRVVPYYNGQWGDQNSTYFGNSGTTGAVDPLAGDNYLSYINWDGTAGVIDSYLKFVLGSTSAQNSPLPFNVQSFKATGKEKKVYLDWTVTNNDQFDSYIVERSKDGIHFETLLTTKAVSTMSTASYHETDAAPYDGWNYYRLRATDQQQNTFYSSVQRVWMGSSSKIEIGPVPARNVLNVYTSDPGSVVELNVVNSLGQVLYQTRTIKAVTEVNVSHLMPGMYYLRIVGKTETTVKPFTKQ